MTDHEHMNFTMKVIDLSHDVTQIANARHLMMQIRTESVEHEVDYVMQALDYLQEMLEADTFEAWGLNNEA